MRKNASAVNNNAHLFGLFVVLSALRRGFTLCRRASALSGL